MKIRHHGSFRRLRCRFAPPLLPRYLLLRYITMSLRYAIADAAAPDYVDMPYAAPISVSRLFRLRHYAAMLMPLLLPLCA